ncbi:MAG: hypothetical protein KZQ93_08220 [Candidatus Thiodiazotropha sp. (ex Monitilora ramsayi)]|nr:hypothetical protein [Candidatus Thiodiazotropha sp. (ex Monitilora ramsayi)]
MKWFFSILVIANLGLFIWLYPQQQKEVKPILKDQDSVGDLRLAGEPVPDVVNEAPDDQVEMEATSPPVEPPSQEMDPEPQETASGVDSPTDEVSVMDTTELPDQFMQAPPVKQCEILGIFEKRAEAELVSAQLRALGVSPDISSETINAQAGYWVLIPSRSTRTEAIATAKNLEAAGVADIWRFTSGELAHAISLGLFTDLERAQARKDQIAALGFDPEVRPRYRQQTRYWVTYAYTGESPLTESKWQELLKIQPQMESKPTNCL